MQPARPPRREVSEVRRHLGFLALAVLLHLGLAPLIDWSAAEKPLKRARIVALDPATAARARSSSRAKSTVDKRLADPTKEEEKKKDEESDKLSGQVVDLPPSPDDRAPEDAKYLSEYNSRVARETVSRHREAVRQNTTNELSHAKGRESSAPTPAQESTALEIGPAKPGAKEDKRQAGRDQAFELPTLARRDRLELGEGAEGRYQNQGPSQQILGNSDRLKLSLGDEKSDGAAQKGSAPKSGPTIADLVPNVGVLARIDGAPANDHLEGIEEGEGTFLNTREFKYATYFNRMKRDVSQHWRPLSEYRRRDPTGNIYGHRARVTVLQVTLNKDGSLKDVEILRSSDVDFLDHEAVSAFKRAEPFPNPPKGLVNSSTGDISFPFGFHIDFSPTSGLRLPF